MFSAGETNIRPGEGRGASRSSLEEQLLHENDWSGFAAPLRYAGVDSSLDQDPSLAERLDGNRDGELTADEYAAAQDGQFSRLPASFEQFRSIARMSVEDPHIARARGIAQIITPGMMASEREAEKRAGYQVAWALIDRAKDEDYEHARETLRQAGQIFGQFGYEVESVACQRQLGMRAEEAKESEDARTQELARGDELFLQGVQALRDGKVDEVRGIAEALPEWHVGGKELFGQFLRSYARAELIERLAPTLMAAKALAAVKVADQEGEDLFGLVDHAGHKAMLARLFAGWEERSLSGEFSDSEAIIRDIWEKDPSVRAAIGFLYGHEAGFRADVAELEAMRGQVFSGTFDHSFKHELLFQDLLAIERGMPASDFGTRLDQLKSQGDQPFDEDLVGQEFTALASVYEGMGGHENYAKELSSRSTMATDVVMEIMLPALIGEWAGAQVVGRMAPWLARLVSKVPIGQTGQAILYTGAIEGTEAVVVSGAFTAVGVGTAVIENPSLEVRPGDVLKQWAGLSICLGFARIAQVPLRGLRRAMGESRVFARVGAEPVIINGHKLPALNPFGRVAYGVADSAAQTGAFYSGGVVGQRLGLRETSPHFFQEWLNLLQFQLGHRMANGMTGGQVSRMAFEAKSRPYLEASRRIAESVVGGRGVEADRLSEAIFLSQVRGEVGGLELVRASDAIGQGGRENGSVDAVLRTNEVLSRIGMTGESGRTLLFDGEKLYTVTPEAREAYLREVEAQRAEGVRRALQIPQVAMASVTEPGKPAHDVSSRGSQHTTASGERGRARDEAGVRDNREETPYAMERSRAEEVLCWRLLREGRTIEFESAVMQHPLEFRLTEGNSVRVPLKGTAYSPQDRTLIVVEDRGGGRFSLEEMPARERARFETETKQRGYATTNVQRDGTTRTDAHTIEYHIVASEVEASTLRFIVENNPFVKVIRYDSQDDLKRGNGEILWNTPRQYRLEELEEEGTVRFNAAGVSIIREGTVVRQYSPQQVTRAFYHYEGRLSPERAADLALWQSRTGRELSEMTTRDGAELLDFLANERGWELHDVQQFIGIEGMRLMYGYGQTLPFGMNFPAELKMMHQGLSAAFAGAGLPVRAEDGSAFIIVGSGVTGYSSKGGMFRWTAQTARNGKPIEPSDFDVRLRVTPAVFEQWMERVLSAKRPNVKKQEDLEHLRQRLAQAQRKGKKGKIRTFEIRIQELEREPDFLGLSDKARVSLRRFMERHGFIRWDNLPLELRNALEPIRQEFSRFQDLIICRQGGKWDNLQPNQMEREGADSIFNTPSMELFP